MMFSNWKNLFDPHGLYRHIWEFCELELIFSTPVEQGPVIFRDLSVTVPE